MEPRVYPKNKKFVIQDMENNRKQIGKPYQSKTVANAALKKLVADIATGDVVVGDRYKFKEEFIKNFPDLDADSAYNKQAVYCFQQWMQKGDVVVATLGNSIVDAIGIIDGDYEFDENKEIPFNHFRKVKWLATNLNTSPKIFIDKNVSQQTIYKFADEDVKLEVFEEEQRIFFRTWDFQVSRNGV